MNLGRSSRLSIKPEGESQSMDPWQFHLGDLLYQSGCSQGERDQIIPCLGTAFTEQSSLLNGEKESRNGFQILPTLFTEVTPFHIGPITEEGEHPNFEEPQLFLMRLPFFKVRPRRKEEVQRPPDSLPVPPPSH